MSSYEVRNSFKHLVSFYMYVLFCICCYFYYLYFVSDSIHTNEPIYGMFFPANIGDHAIYYRNYLDIKNDAFHLDGINNAGVAYIYYLYFSACEFLLIEHNPQLLSLILNLFVFFFCFTSFRRIVKSLHLKIEVVWIFVLNSSFWYFAQLINKDVFTILILFKAVEYSILKRLPSIVLLMLVSALVRVQLPILIMVYMFLVLSKPTIRNFIFVYVAISLINGYVSRYQTIFIGEETLADGVSSFIYRLNIQFGLGSLFLNPLRVVQSFYSVLDSFNYELKYGVDISKIKNIPQLLVMLVFLPFTIKAFYNYKYYMNTPVKYVMAIVPSFFLVWFLNPTINSRYIMLIIPFFTLVGLYSYKYKIERSVH